MIEGDAGDGWVIGGEQGRFREAGDANVVRDTITALTQQLKQRGAKQFVLCNNAIHLKSEKPAQRKAQRFARMKTEKAAVPRIGALKVGKRLLKSGLTGFGDGTAAVIAEQSHTVV